MNEKVIIAARKEFGRMFKEMREAKGLSQAEVGDFCGVTSRTIEKIEGGKYPYSIDLFFKLSVILEFTISLAPKATGPSSRFVLQKSKKEGFYVLTDSVNEIVCTFEAGKFYDQKISFLNDVKLSAGQIATIMREMGDFMANNYPELI